MLNSAIAIAIEHRSLSLTVTNAAQLLGATGGPGTHGQTATIPFTGILKTRTRSRRR